MSITIVQFGSPRRRSEGLRIGTVRRPPRGVHKSQWARRNFFDVWLPNLAPSAALMRKTSIQEDGSGWSAFARHYEAELKQPAQSHLLDALAALSKFTNFSVGCYCNDEERCHRSILRRVLRDRGAIVK